MIMTFLPLPIHDDDIGRSRHQNLPLTALPLTNRRRGWNDLWRQVA